MYGHNNGKNYSIHIRGVAGWKMGKKKLNDGIRTKTLVSKTLLIF
jgi:hypothetical protein